MKEPRNIYEKTLWDILKAGGWETLKNGWPDILAVKDGRVAVFEVKAKRSEILKADQMQCMDLLSRAGVECYRWDKDTGFLPYSERMPDIKALNNLEKKRTDRKANHTCPICGKEKAKNDIVCYYCQRDPGKGHQINLLQMKAKEHQNKQIIESSNKQGLY